VERYSDWLDPKNDRFNMEKELLLLEKYEPIFDPIRLLAVSATCADFHRNEYPALVSSWNTHLGKAGKSWLF
jgi:hypothetical protein